MHPRRHNSRVHLAHPVGGNRGAGSLAQVTPDYTVAVSDLAWLDAPVEECSAALGRSNELLGRTTSRPLVTRRAQRLEGHRGIRAAASGALPSLGSARVPRAQENR